MKKLLILPLLFIGYLSSAQLYVGGNIYNRIDDKRIKHSSLYQLNVGYTFNINNLYLDCTPFQLTTVVPIEKPRYTLGWSLAFRYYLTKNKK